MIREAPGWFNDELARVGGLNRYGEPIFKLVWSPEATMVVGGRFADGHIGYRNSPLAPGHPAWALLLWEGPDAYGDPLDWEYQYRDMESGLLACGSFPRYGRYRLLKKLIHFEQVQREEWKMIYRPKSREIDRVLVQKKEIVVTRMEPSGLILDLMIPMLQAWKRLSYKQKLEAVKEKQERQSKELDRVIKDAQQACRIRRGSQLVQKRAEIIEKGMEEAMRIASRYGLGMVTEAA